MSTAESIEGFLVEELAAAEAGAGIDHDEDLLAAELIDSLGIQELVKFLERSYGIQVQDDDLVAENFQTINAIAGFVEAKRG
jgi:acyl carrier protein